MKVIDILNKIANDEEVPKKIKFDDKTYYYDKYLKNFKTIDENGIISSLDEYKLIHCINSEVEIIEEPTKIEKIEPLGIDYMTLDDIKFTFSNSEMVIVNKINEIIDYINNENFHNEEN